MVSRLTGLVEGKGSGGSRGNGGDGGNGKSVPPTDRQQTGQAGEARALAYLLTQGLRLLMRNYRVATGPGARAGEVDLIMRASDGTLVFVEVRARASRSQGGAAASIGPRKRARIVYAAQHYLARWRGPLPPCRFDVVAIDGDALEWLPAAFDAT